MSVENLNGEIWKDVITELGTYPNYQVSNMGRVKSLNYNRTGKERLMKQTKDKDGYLRVGLCRKGERQKSFFVHRLVAYAFLENPLNLSCINHKSEIKTENFADNLEFCSVAYNNSYGTRIERILETQKTSNAFREGHKKRVEKISKTVYQYTTDLQLVNIYPSVSEASRQTGFLLQSISYCCNGKYNTSYGFIWSYEPIETSSNQLTLFPITTKKIS